MTWIRETAPGISDDGVLAMASAERRVCVTFDKDFGELAARSGLTEGYGVLLLRIPMRRSTHIATEIADALAARTDWVGHFSVLEPGRVRMRRLAT